MLQPVKRIINAHLPIVLEMYVWPKLQLMGLHVMRMLTALLQAGAPVQSAKQKSNQVAPVPWEVTSA